MIRTEDCAWFIDAWAVHDGKVFASRRASESIAANATVFMSVPDLEAVPVGRISTALRATRSGFQEGLRTHDHDLAEIPFTDLRQVRDLVRRAYLAAGLGPGSPGAIAGPLPRPDLGPGPASRFLEQESFGPHGPWAPVYLEADPPPDLDRAVYTVAQATILEWDRYLADQDPDETRALVGWLSALSRAGIFPGQADGSVGEAPIPMSPLQDLADRHGAWHLRAALELILDRWVPGYPLETRISGYWSRSHLASVPLPVAPGWPTAVRRLADMSLLPVIDRRFWQSTQQVSSLDVAPLVLSHAIRQPARSGRLPGERSVAQAAYDRARASMVWFEEIALPIAAEKVLAEFIDRCLSGHTTDPPTSPQEPGGPIVSGGPSGTGGPVVSGGPGASRTGQFGWGQTSQALPG
jgi:hypothetical protein